MPISVGSTKFLQKRGEEPIYSTEDFWAKFTYQMIGTVKNKPDKLITLEGNSSNSDEIALNIEICKGAFLEALGDEAIAEIQLKNPKTKIYEQKMGWLKDKWEDCWKPNKNVTEKLIKVWNGHREKNVDIYQHWLTVGENLARSNLDQLEGKQIEKELHVAAYLNTVKNSELTKQLWEKRDNHNDMEKFIKASVEADREFDKLHKRNCEVKVKEEPVNKIDRKKKIPQKEKSCFRCGELGWTKEHIKVCKARKHQCEMCGKLGHLEKLCRKGKKGNEIVKRVDGDEESTDSETTDSESSKSEGIARVIEEKRNLVKNHRVEKGNRGWERLPVRRVRAEGRTFKRSGCEFEFMLKVNGKKIAAILDTGSPISIMPKNYAKVVKPKNVIRKESSRKFVDVNGRPKPITNRYKMLREMNGIEKSIIWWEVETNTKPIIGMDSFDKLGLQLIQRPTRDREFVDSGKNNQVRKINQECNQACNQELSQKCEELKNKVKEKFRNLFQVNTTVKDFEYDVQFKEKMEIKQQKGRRIPIHMQRAVEAELEKLMKEGHVEKLDEVGEEIFVSPVIVTRKSDGSVKTALDAVKLNRQIVRKTMQMPILAELLDQISITISEGRGKPLFISTIDLKYAFGQIALHKNIAKHCVAAIVGGKATGHYRFKKGFYGLADMPVVFQSKIDRVLDNSAKAWQDDIIVVTRGSEEEHQAELETVLEKLQASGYKASIEKSKLFQNEAEWCGYRIKPKTTRTESVLKIGAPKGVKEIRSFLGSVQYLAKFIEKLSAKTEPLRKLLIKDEKWIWGPEQQAAFEGLKRDIANITMLKHYDPEAQTVLTTDANTKGLGATLWQIDESGRRAVAFASRFLCNAEKRYAIIELELVAVKWAVEHFKFYLLGRKFRVETDHKALVSVFGRHRLNKEYSSRLTDGD